MTYEIAEIQRLRKELSEQALECLKLRQELAKLRELEGTVKRLIEEMIS